MHEGQTANCAALIANGATRDLGASPELTPLRVAIRSGNAAMVSWLLSHAGAGPAAVWDDDLFQALLDKTPGAAWQFLDQFASEQPVAASTASRHAGKSDGKRMVAVMYRSLRALYGEPHVPVDATALGVAVASGARGKHVLPHRVLRYLMATKWHAFARDTFRRQLVAYCSFVAAFYVPMICANRDWEKLNTTFDYLVLLARIGAWFCALYLLVRVEWPEVAAQGWRTYLSSLWNLLNAVSYGAALVAVPIEFASDMNNLRDCLLALLTVAMWVNMLQFLQMSTTSGLLLAMMTRMVRDVHQFLIMYAVFLVGFTGAFYILLRGELGFESFVNAFLSVFLMLYGNVNYDVVLNHGSGSARYMAHALLISYLVGAVTVLLNILIAMMATTYADIWASAEQETLRGHALAILRMEKALTAYQRQHIFDKLLVRDHDASAAGSSSTAKSVNEDEETARESSFVPQMNFFTRSGSVGQVLAARLEQKREMLTDVVNKVRALSPRVAQAREALASAVNASPRMSNAKKAFEAAVSSSPTWAAVKPAMQAGAASFRAQAASFTPPDLDALKESLYVKSAFDIDEAVHQAQALASSGVQLAKLEDGVRFELAADKRRSDEDSADEERRTVNELKQQIQQLAAVAKDLQSQQRKLMQINHLQSHRASLERYYAPPGGAGAPSAAPQAV